MFANLNALRMPMPVGPARPAWGMGGGFNPAQQPIQPPPGVGAMPSPTPAPYQPMPINNGGMPGNGPMSQPVGPAQPSWPGMGGGFGGGMQGGQFDPQQLMNLMAMRQMMTRQSY